ncbi:MAG: flagellar biosynthetic protein FliQ [Candidatus Azotimanducaceae bacterium]
MDTSLVMDIAVESLKVTALVGAPVLGAALISGLLIGVLQGSDLDPGNDIKFHTEVSSNVARFGAFW